MNRRTLLAATGCLAMGAWARSVTAAPGRPTIAVLGGAKSADSVRAVLERLQSLGWEDGRTATIVVRGGLSPQLPALAAELALFRPDLVVAAFDPSIKAVAQAIPDVPIVMANALDPVGNGWIKSLREPGGRFTGTAWTQDASITGKYVELLAEVVPGMRRIGGLIDPGFSGIGVYRTAFEAAAARLGIESIHAPLSAIEGLPEAMRTLATARAQAMFVYGSWVSGFHGPAIANAAAAARLPACYLHRETVEAGGLMAYGPSIPDSSRRAAEVADRILRGESPARIPIEQATRYELVVNLGAAKAMGLRLPAAVLARADAVIE